MGPRSSRFGAIANVISCVFFSEHIIVHVPYNVHTHNIHHHHFQPYPVIKHVPIVKHVPIIKEVPIVKEVAIPVHLPAYKEAWSPVEPGWW